MIKVNLGSGKDYLKGWVNVDVNPLFSPDVVADLSKKLPFKDDSVAEIKAFDILEHFTKEDGEKFIKECFRILKTNGKIIIRTPNIYEIFESFGNDPEVLFHFLYGNSEESGTFGSHKYAYSEKSLRKIFKFYGFKINSIKKETTNFLIIAEKNPLSKKDLKIAVIEQSPGMGGAEYFMLSLVSTFKKKGAEILFAANKGEFSDEIKKKKIETTEIPFILDIIGNTKGFIKSLILFPVMVFYYFNLLINWKMQEVDLILMTGFSEKLLVSVVAKILNVKVFWIEYGPLYPVFKKNLYFPKIAYRLIKEIPEKVIVPSLNTQLSLIKDAKVSLSRIEKIPCGVELKKINIKKSDKEFVIGNVSRITEYKGQKLLIEAFAIAAKTIKNAKLILVGEGPALNTCKEMVKMLGIKDKVEFTRFVKDVNRYYEKMDLFIFPSLWGLEGFGVVILEAMQYKIPVIATARGGTSDIILNGQNGFIIEPNAKEISDRIIKLYKDKKLAEQIGKKAFETVVNKYNIDLIAEKYLELFYKEL